MKIIAPKLGHMNKVMRYVFLFSSIYMLGNHGNLFSQKVGVGILTPEARLHIKGDTNISQLCIDADTIQSNTNPLIRLRKSNGEDLMWINSDNPVNLFIGVNSGRVNNSAAAFCILSANISTSP